MEGTLGISPSSAASLGVGIPSALSPGHPAGDGQLSCHGAACCLGQPGFQTVSPQETSQRQGFIGVLYSFSLHLACPSLGLGPLACGRLMTALTQPDAASAHHPLSSLRLLPCLSEWGRVQEPPSWHLLGLKASSTTSLAPASSSSRCFSPANVSWHGPLRHPPHRLAHV